MSILRVDNFGPSAGGTTYSAGGIAKAWVHFNTSTSTTLYSPSLNISSLTDNGTGNTTVTMTNAFTGADGYNTCGTDDYYGMCNCGESAGRSASAFRVHSYTNSFSFIDCNHTSVSMFGDLA